MILEVFRFVFDLLGAVCNEPKQKKKKMETRSSASKVGVVPTVPEDNNKAKLGEREI